MAAGEGHGCELHGGGEEGVKALSEQERRVIARILKVNHGGEHGAIRIYGAQIAVAKKLYPDIVPLLGDMLGHEIEHHRKFAEAMPSRSARPCCFLFFWAWGGSILGLLTALAGRRMIWICTEAVEAAVHEHLVDQLKFLQTRDFELYQLIFTIRDEEVSHLENAIERRGKENLLSRWARRTIGLVTDVLIWMSTSGDSRRLKFELGRTD